MTLAALNAMDRADFVEAIGWIFELSPWVAEAVSDGRPYPSIASLHTAMVNQVETAPAARQLALLRAHPDLGTRARISAASTTEQAGAGLDRLTPAEFERLERLNAAYRDKFGFPFLFAVKGSTKYDILQALERRLATTHEEERREALRQVYGIAEFRLRETIE
jgi:2-oxo-4-hydroxy-4-carboxy-5-ureidoimidazoline decarboxylase